MSFPPVVASGPRACTLHYITNDHEARSGDLIFVDVGCELYGYCSDISRAWPRDGIFSPAQRDLYNMLLEVQLECIRHCSAPLPALSSSSSSLPTLDELHTLSITLIEDGLAQLGILRHTERGSNAYRRYYPHAIGHYLGMDVHDVHSLPKNIPLANGVAFTIEPGVYIPSDDERAPAHFRGLGLRIEDDLIVADLRAHVLSERAAKTIAQVEALLAD